MKFQKGYNNTWTCKEEQKVWVIRKKAGEKGHFLSWQDLEARKEYNAGWVAGNLTDAKREIAKTRQEWMEKGKI